MNTPIYLDYNATTPIDSEVADEMKPFLADYFGNPSSSHSFGIKTKIAVENARKQLAELINCNSSEIIFTSGICIDCDESDSLTSPTDTTICSLMFQRQML